MNLRPFLRRVALAAALLAAGGASAQVRIAYVDPLSGGGATIGEHGLRQMRFLADAINARGGVLGGQKLEVVAHDNRGDAQDSVVQVRKAIDAGARVVVQGNGSGAALAISDAVARHNADHPGREVLYLNYGAIDPSLTNDRCSFWHFSFDANSDVKMAALTNFMRDKGVIRKVYVIGQDYAFGRSVRQAAVEMLKVKRPDVQIVGDELHPLLTVTDFAPHVARIKASGADSVITGNWGNDMSRLLRAAADAGLDVAWYTYYAGLAGSPTAIRRAGLEHRVYQVSEWHSNVPSREMESFTEGFAKAQGDAGDRGWWYLRMKNAVEMLAAALDKAGSAEPKKVALALHDMRFRNSLGAEVFMRPDDHALFQNLYVSSFGPRTKHDEERTGWGWETEGMVRARDTVVPTTCRMTVPQ